MGKQQPVAEHGWSIWSGVPEGFSGVWRVTSRRGWTYFGGFSRGTLLVGMRLSPETDDETKASWLAMIELTVACAEPATIPVLPIRPARVLEFPVTQSLSAS